MKFIRETSGKTLLIHWANSPPRKIRAFKSIFLWNSNYDTMVHWRIYISFIKVGTYAVWKMYFGEKLFKTAIFHFHDTKVSDSVIVLSPEVAQKFS